MAVAHLHLIGRSVSSRIDWLLQPWSRLVYARARVIIRQKRACIHSYVRVLVCKRERERKRERVTTFVLNAGHDRQCACACTSESVSMTRLHHHDHPRRHTRSTNYFRRTCARARTHAYAFRLGVSEVCKYATSAAQDFEGRRPELHCPWSSHCSFICSAAQSPGRSQSGPLQQ